MYLLNGRSVLKMDLLVRGYISPPGGMLGNRAGSLCGCSLVFGHITIPHTNTIYYILYIISYTITLSTYTPPPYTLPCHRPIISTVYYTIFNNTIYKSTI